MRPTVLITGATGDIGRAIATVFCDEGYSLVLTGRNKSVLERLQAELSAKGCDVLCAAGDLTEYDFVQELVAQGIARFGTLSVLVNNAGISSVGLLSELPPAEWNRVLAVNLTAAYTCTSLVIPHMVRRKEGRILNVSSVWGNCGASCEVAYSASKGGLNAMTRALAKELAPSGISVNALACGLIDTRMNACFTAEETAALVNEIPCGRMGTPTEVAQLLLLLAKAPSYLTGQIITMDGAWT